MSGRKSFPDFLHRERERERAKNRARKKDHSVTYSEINNSRVNLTI